MSHKKKPIYRPKSKGKKKKKGRKKPEAKRYSEFNAVIWYLGLFACAIEFIIGIRYYNSLITFDRNFGLITLAEGVFGFIGLVSIDVIYGHGFRLKPKNEDFRSMPFFKTVRDTLIITAMIFFIQLMTVFIPMTVSNFVIGFAIIFASVCEELFFRGFLIGAVKRGSKYIKLKRYKFGLFMTISFLEMIGVILSALLFSLIHVNYYDTPNVLIGIFFGGIALSLAFLKTDDLTPLIFAHLFLNIYSVIRVLGFTWLWVTL